MSHVSTADLIAQLEQDDENYTEVLSEDSMSVELGRYPNPEPKHPHKEDELYFVISGSGMAAVGDETYPIEEGDVVYVEQGVEHDFFDIDEELTALIVFTDSEDSVLDQSP
ncbi:cupin domain-containing protein [Salinibaculum rarum]|uniref:cupin domain-containing protein n=1 Tax=Salinibaculum rarum TaxID=3058903 RepID=UPI00265F05C9|nr:cupin domain-containing protein [Salinibaculum sp. KK48]